ncbi:hypothetical protein K439DRAFT_1623234 [Ramaria rubella]|nr:hypothetical protein K439DRAFT_1623234 [Ramaria rubella]
MASLHNYQQITKVLPPQYPKPWVGTNLDHASVCRAAAAETRDHKHLAREAKEAKEREVLMGRAIMSQAGSERPSMDILDVDVNRTENPPQGAGSFSMQAHTRPVVFSMTALESQYKHVMSRPSQPQSPSHMPTDIYAPQPPYVPPGQPDIHPGQPYFPPGYPYIPAGQPYVPPGHPSSWPGSLPSYFPTLYLLRTDSQPQAYAMPCNSPLPLTNLGTPSQADHAQTYSR